MLLTSVIIVSGALVAIKTRPSQKRNRKKRATHLLTNYSQKRKQQLATLSAHSAETERSESEAEKKVNHYFKVSSVALALSTGGALVYKPLYLISLPFLLVTIRPLLEGAYHSLVKEKKVGVAVLDSVGTVGPLLLGHFFIAALASWLSNIGRKLLIKTEDQSRNSLINVFKEQPTSVLIQVEDVELDIPFEQLQIGDLVVVDSSHTIPIDGIVHRGIASVDQRILTGESQPVEKKQGDEVFASTLVLEGKIYIYVEKMGTETVASQIGEILNCTADFKSGIQSKGERVVEQGAIPSIIISAITLPLLGAESALAAMYAAFGYHMRFAAPVSVLNFLHITAENGILIKDGRSLELLSQVDTFVFDKTGTLTEDIPAVGRVYPCHGYDEDELLAYAAASEHKQTHPIALAIQQEATRRQLNVPTITDAKVKVGYGVSVTIENISENTSTAIHIGNRRFMEKKNIPLTAEIKKRAKSCYQQGSSLIYLAINNQLGGIIELQVSVRPEIKAIISELKERQLEVYILSGDHEKPTKKLADELGIERYFAETLPQNKALLIKQLQQQGKSVCFVGDGINDSIALKQANVSISLQGASTAATDTASIVLMDNSLKKLIKLLDISQELETNLSRSLTLTILPGVVCISGVYFLHFGLVSAVMLYNAGLVTSLSNALWPLIKHQRTQKIKHINSLEKKEK